MNNNTLTVQINCINKNKLIQLDNRRVGASRREAGERFFV